MKLQCLKGVKAGHTLISYSWFIVISALVLFISAGIAHAGTVSVTKVLDIKSSFEHPFDQPSSFSVDSKGNIYLLNDLKENVLIFNSNGKYVSSFGNKTEKGIDLYNAYSITCDEYNLIHIYEPYQSAVLTFDNKGALKKTTPLLFNDELLHKITDIAFIYNSYYVLDNANNIFYVFNTKGKLVNKVGSKGELNKEFNNPFSMTFGSDGKLYITDVLNSRVQVFASTGAFLNKISGFGFTDGGIFRPNGVAVDSRLNVYISDAFLGVIYVFDSAGKYISPLMEKGKMLKMKSPSRLKIVNNRLYVLEMLPSKITIYDIQ